MTGRRYYITSLADWHRHTHRFANSHWLPLNESASAPVPQQAETAALLLSGERPEQAGAEMTRVACAEQPIAAEAKAKDKAEDKAEELSPSVRVLVLIDADEGVHLALEDDSAFEALPHPLAQKSISDAAQSALEAYGVAPGATTFDVTEIVSRAHPLLRHRVF